jgi:hypothetical protein
MVVKKRLSSKAVAVLLMVAEGHTYEQVLAAYPALSYLDIFQAAQEALALLGEGPPLGHVKRMVEIKKANPRAYEKWTEEEDEKLIQEVKGGIPTKVIAQAHERQPSAIRSRMVKLNLVDPQETKDLPR